MQQHKRNESQSKKEIASISAQLQASHMGEPSAINVGDLRPLGTGAEKRLQLPNISKSATIEGVSPLEHDTFFTPQPPKLAFAHRTGGPKRFSTEAFQNRMKAIHHTDLPFPSDVPKLSSELVSSTKLNPKVLEAWINETLKDSQKMDISGGIIKTEGKNPMFRFGIDRETLIRHGVSNESIDRLYRALFVYSIGFHELTKSCMTNSAKKFSVITSIWKVFAILLEYSCKSDYRMLIAQIGKEHKTEIEQVEKEYLSRMEEKTEAEQTLKSNIEYLQQCVEDLERERESQRQQKKRIEEELSENVKAREEEVQFRLKFETKLNSIHSVYRDLQARYNTAVDDLKELVDIKKGHEMYINDLINDTTKLKTQIAQQKIDYEQIDEKYKNLSNENEYAKQRITELETNLDKKTKDNSALNVQTKELEKEKTDEKLKYSTDKDQVDIIRQENEIIKNQLKEKRELLEQVNNKYDETHKELIAALGNYQTSERKVINLTENERITQEKLNLTKKELESKLDRFEELAHEVAILEVKVDATSREKSELANELHYTSDKLSIVTKVRNHLETELSELQLAYAKLGQELRDKDDELTKKIRLVDKLTKRIQELERQIESNEMRRKALEKQMDIQKQQLNEKITSLEDILNSEKDSRELWISKFERETKEHLTTKEEVLNLNGNIKDLELKISTLEVEIEAKNQMVTDLTEERTELQTNVNQIEINNENLSREIQTLQELNKKLEIHFQEKVSLMKAKKKQKIAAAYFELHQNEMCMEDARSYGIRAIEQHQISLDLLTQTKTALEEEKKKSGELQEELEKQINWSDIMTEDFREHLRTLTELKVSNEMNESMVHLLKEEKAEFETRNRDMLNKLEEDSKIRAEFGDMRSELNTTKEHLKDFLDKLNSGVEMETQTERVESSIHVQTELSMEDMDRAPSRSKGSRGSQRSHHRGDEGDPLVITHINKDQYGKIEEKIQGKGGRADNKAPTQKEEKRKELQSEQIPREPLIADPSVDRRYSTGPPEGKGEGGKGPTITIITGKEGEESLESLSLEQVRYSQGQYRSSGEVGPDSMQDSQIMSQMQPAEAQRRNAGEQPRPTKDNSYEITMKSVYTSGGSKAEGDEGGSKKFKRKEKRKGGKGHEPPAGRLPEEEFKETAKRATSKTGVGKPPPIKPPPANIKGLIRMANARPGAK